VCGSACADKRLSVTRTWAISLVFLSPGLGDLVEAVNLRVPLDSAFRNTTIPLGTIKASQAVVLNEDM